MNGGIGVEERERDLKGCLESGQTRISARALLIPVSLRRTLLPLTISSMHFFGEDDSDSLLSNKVQFLDPKVIGSKTHFWFE